MTTDKNDTRSFGEKFGAATIGAPFREWMAFIFTVAGVIGGVVFALAHLPDGVLSVLGTATNILAGLALTCGVLVCVVTTVRSFRREFKRHGAEEEEAS